MCVKCVRVCVCERVEGSEGISIGCERGKGSCLWPDLAQGGGQLILSGAFIGLSAISLSQRPLSNPY